MRRLNKRWFVWFGAGLLILIFVIRAHTQAPTNPVSENGDSETVGFVLREPEGAGSQTALFVFHGGGGSAERVEQQTDFTALGREYGFTVVYPDSGGDQWNDHRPQTDGFGNDVTEIKDFVTRLRESGYEKIYATGISNGGMFTYRLACEAAGVFDGFAPVAANLPVGAADDCAPEFARPLLVQQGTADPLMKYDGGQIPAGERRGVGGTVISADETLSFWVDRYQCGETPTQRVLGTPDSDELTVVRTEWGSCADGVPIVQLRYEGGGHAWYGLNEQSWFREVPRRVGESVSASEQIISFFGLGRE